MVPNPNAAGIIIKTFGIQSVSTNIYKGKIEGVEKDKSPIKRLAKNGMPIFSDLQFSPTDLFGGGEMIEHIPIDLALFTVQQQKKIVVTDIAGRDYAITEYIGKSNYNINIKGVIMSNKPGVRPQEDIDNLIAFLDYSQSLGINSKWLNDTFNIMEVVIVDYDIPEEEGMYSQQSFEINCRSERPVEVLISEAN